MIDDIIEYENHGMVLIKYNVHGVDESRTLHLKYDNDYLYSISPQLLCEDVVIGIPNKNTQSIFKTHGNTTASTSMLAFNNNNQTIIYNHNAESDGGIDITVSKPQHYKICIDNDGNVRIIIRINTMIIVSNDENGNCCVQNGNIIKYLICVNGQYQLLPRHGLYCIKNQVTITQLNAKQIIKAVMIGAK